MDRTAKSIKIFQPLAQMPPTIRCFFALALNEPWRRALTPYLNALKKADQQHQVKWVLPQNLHITVRFLGQVASEKIEELLPQVQASIQKIEAFALNLQALTVFPSVQKPRVIVLALTPDIPLLNVAKAVETSVVAAGFKPETRVFNAHLTLGRVRDHQQLILPELKLPELSPLLINSLTLYRSNTLPSGAEYTKLAEILF